jgi:hypothetical protein
MFTSTSKLLAGTAAVALLIGLTAGIGQAADPSLPQQQAALPANSTPPLPLGHDDIREVQNQLIALGFDPGPADGQIGPATTAAADQYDRSHGGSGRVSIDSMLLARLKADPGPRLTYDQVAARAQSRQQALQGSGGAAAPSAAPSSAGANQFGGIVQQIVPLIGAMIANSNNNNYGPGYYGPGPGYGPSYYAPAPGYYSHRYGYGGW